MTKTYFRTGVYAIRNRKNGKLYIGSTGKSLSGRIKGHRKGLNSGEHGNRYLQRAWNKYGASAFVFMILEHCPKELCLIREQYWIDKFDSANPRFGYNLSPTAGSVLGLKHSKESRKRHSNRAKRQWADPVARAMRSEAAKNRMSDPREREKVSIKLTGRKLPPETCRKMAIAATKHWADPVIREKMLVRQKHLGWKNPVARERAGSSQKLRKLREKQLI